MDAQELYFGDGKSSGLWLCSTCKRADTSLEFANRCCQPRKCPCGISLRRHSAYMSCEACQKVKEENAEAARFAKAIKLTVGEYDGPIFTRGDRFYMDIEDYLDQRENRDEETYVWCTTPVKFEPDVHDMLENALDKHHEDAYDNIPMKEIVDLQAHVDKWAEKQCIVSYEIDLKRCVIIESEADQPLIVGENG